MFLSFVAYFLIPAYTVLFVQGSNWFTTNFSVIGNLVDRKAEFVLWGLMVEIYFFWCLRRIVASMPKKPRGTWLIPTCIVLLTFAITTPYLPEELPLKAFLHVIFAFMAAVCLIVCLYLIVWKLYRSSKKEYRSYLIGLVGITIFSVALLILAGIVSSALEIFFTISLTIMVQRLYLRCCHITRQRRSSQRPDAPPPGNIE